VELTNSKRLLYTANYVSTLLKPDEQHKMESHAGGGFKKANFLRSLRLQARDLGPLKEAVLLNPGQNTAELNDLLSILQKLTTVDRPMSTMELAGSLAKTSYEALLNIAKSAATLKNNTELGLLIELFNRQRRISPIGRIHLERVEMYPAGVQKGELVFTVPMAPGETVTVSHKEWSTSTREFEEIVEDFFESYSEKGVAEKSDSSMAAENEARHANALNFGVSLSGQYMGVTLTSTFGLSSTNEERESVKRSMETSREVTQKASARTRREHKISIKLEEKRGTEDSSFRTISNPTLHAIRVDYYKMMRKWRTDLFRYGLRQTYDIAIPVPGVRLWAQHQRLDALDKQIRAPLQFGMKPTDINPGNFRIEANKVGAVVPDEPPFQIVEDRVGGTDRLEKDPAGDSRFGEISFDVPQGYYLAEANFTAHCAVWEGHPVAFYLLNISDSPLPFPASQIVGSLLPELIHRTGHLTVRFGYRYISSSSIQIHNTYRRNVPGLYEAWQQSVWQLIRAATEARHQEEIARLREERDCLFTLLNGKDTLTLRRLEREELMRLIIQWLLGPTHPAIATATVEKTIMTLLANERAFQGATVPITEPTFVSITEDSWSEALVFGEMVKFIHQAIEWENLLYFLYPYFWGSETVGRDKMLFTHADPEHEKFLRAGYARVVLPVRPGFEVDFTTLVEEGSLSGISNSPYLPVAQDIAHFAKTNYAGIPPANPETESRPLLFPEQRATWETMQKAMQKLDALKAGGQPYPAKLADLAGGPYLDAWGNAFVYRMPGYGADYDLISLGEDNKKGGEGLDADISSAAGASLVATWFDYTPTSAIDIEVDTKPEDIA
jgi:Type II secretion system (T2SS), protein G